MASAVELFELLAHRHMRMYTPMLLSLPLSSSIKIFCLKQLLLTAFTDVDKEAFNLTTETLPQKNPSVRSAEEELAPNNFLADT